MRIRPTKPAYHGVVVVGTEKVEDRAAQIEATQEVLRNSIEQTKRLAEEVDKLVQQNRQSLDIGDREP